MSLHALICAQKTPQFISFQRLGDAVATLSVNVRRTAGIVLFLMLSAVLTFMGFYFSWRQVHSPDWTRWIALALLLPFAGVNKIFHWFAGAEPLQGLLYHIAFGLGSIAQLLYYFAIFTLLKRLLPVSQRAELSTVRKGERE
jgi:hypothetical protein